MSALYQIPFPLNYTDDLSAENIKRLRQRLLVDLDLAGGQTLTIGEKAYTKDDILKICDTAMRGMSPEVAHALVIRQCPWLFDFLTQGIIDASTGSEPVPPAWHDAALEAHIYPFLVEAYWQAWLHAFQTMDEVAAQRWSDFHPTELFLRARQEALLSIRIYLERDLELTNRNYTAKSGQAAGYHSPAVLPHLCQLVRLINVLPPEFQDIKTAYAKAWHRLVIHTLMERKKRMAKKKLACLHDLLPEGSPVRARLHKEYEEAFNPVSEKPPAPAPMPEVYTTPQPAAKSTSDDLQWVGWMLGILIFIAIKAC